MLFSQKYHCYKYYYYKYLRRLQLPPCPPCWRGVWPLHSDVCAKGHPRARCQSCWHRGQAGAGTGNCRIKYSPAVAISISAPPDTLSAEQYVSIIFLHWPPLQPC